MLFKDQLDRFKAMCSFKLYYLTVVVERQKPFSHYMLITKQNLMSTSQQKCCDVKIHFAY